MTTPCAEPPAPRLLDRLRTELRSRHYSRRTEQAYVLWTRRFVRYHRTRHPRLMGEREVNEFLTHLAIHGNVSASTQKPSPQRTALPLRPRPRPRPRRPRHTGSGQEARAASRRNDAAGSAGCAPPDGRRHLAHGQPHVRVRAPAPGMSPATGPTYRHGHEDHPRTRWQGLEGPDDHALHLHGRAADGSI
jgi:hypothetical protein